MPAYFEIAVNVPRVSGFFHYHASSELASKLDTGHLVLVPFGAQIVQGVVLRRIRHPQVPETKAVERLIDQHPALSEHQLRLAAQLAEDTLAPLAACIGLMLPPGVGRVADVQYQLTPEAGSFEGELSSAQRRIVQLLGERGALRGRQLDRALPRRNWRSTVTALTKKGLVASEPVLPLPSARPKTVRTAELIVSPREFEGNEDRLGSSAATRMRRANLLEILARAGGPVDVSEIYAQSENQLADLRRLEELELIRLSEREALRDPLADLAYDPGQAPILTSDQQEVWERVREALGRANGGEGAKPILLHGVTGSGKTEIYLRAVAETLALGRQAIVLVPEIALTPQSVRRFLGRFPGEVGLLHSELSDGERYDTWRRAREGRLKVILGPRSALFAPLQDIGLIVVDESHDDSYYEANQTPHYHARRAAVSYARITGALCLMGSATPEITSSYLAERHRWDLLRLPARILAHRATARAHQERLGVAARYQSAGEASALDLPPVKVVDMRQELRQGNRSIFSRALQEALALTLSQGQQAILFLNRRGRATYIFCRDCGHSLRCPNCETPLTQHVGKNAFQTPKFQNGQLICHHCGYSRQQPLRCPNCGSQRIRQYGTGTQSVEEQVRELFPDARTLRWDRESTRRKGSHERILNTFSRHEADVLIGTQMLAKGLDLPLVTLVGVVLADVGLHLPDYRAAERVFQVLTQVAGRAGRSPLGGEVVLQTFHPEHYVIQAAAQHDYEAFYEQEIAQRRRLRFPPFAQLVRLLYSHLEADKAEEHSAQMARRVRQLLREKGKRNTEMIGPAPCFYTRLNREYRWQLILRGPDPASVLRDVKLMGWQVEINPPALL